MYRIFLQILFPVVFICCQANLFGQRQITFLSEDEVEITADLYYQHINYPFIILTHGLSASRGEYNFLADKLTNLQYNCLAVDLRVGDESNFIHNETVRNLNNHQPKNIDALKDINAAIQYAFKKSNLPVILFGNTFSASLCLLAAKGNSKVQAVIGFTPGEYFNCTNVSTSLHAYDKQLFIGCSHNEKNYIENIIKQVPKNLVYTSCHPAPLGIRGVDLLSDKNPDNGPFWLDLLFYFNTLSGQN